MESGQAGWIGWKDGAVVCLSAMVKLGGLLAVAVELPIGAGATLRDDMLINESMMFCWGWVLV